MEASEDKRLARLYDYTKFHVGIYLSFAAGISALLGTEKTGWFVATLVSENRPLLYCSLLLMLLAGMCGGIVASSTIECEAFDDFWTKPQGPQALSRLSRRRFLHWLRRLCFHGSTWAMLEHIFFWASLLFLAYAVAIGFARTPTSADKNPPPPAVLCCCGLSASSPSCSAR
jgi:hypothetical protein